MENNHLITQEEIRKLKELNARLKKELLPFGITLDTVPEQLSGKLNEYVDVQMLTGLSDINTMTLQEFYLEKKKQQLDQRLAAMKLQTEVEDLKKQIEKETKHCEVLEKFVTKHSDAEVDLASTKLLLKKKLENLQSKHENFNIPEEFNIEELLKEIEMLKQRDAESKK